MDKLYTQDELDEAVKTAVEKAAVDADTEIKRLQTELEAARSAKGGKASRAIDSLYNPAEAEKSAAAREKALAAEAEKAG